MCHHVCVQFVDAYSNPSTEAGLHLEGKRMSDQLGAARKKEAIKRERKRKSMENDSKPSDLAKSKREHKLNELCSVGAALDTVISECCKKSGCLKVSFYYSSEITSLLFYLYFNARLPE